jgi:hypothetical protein
MPMALLNMIIISVIYCCYHRSNSITSSVRKHLRDIKKGWFNTEESNLEVHHTHVHRLTHTHTQMHMHTLTHTHTRAHTQMHMHTLTD